MRYLSLCSGIEAATVAWNPLGFKATAYSEIEPYSCHLLNHYYPETPNLGDMSEYSSWPELEFDLSVAGTPCQSFSIVGRRAGLDDPRGHLALIYLGIVRKFRPRWFLWENVAGVLSSGGNRDFASFLSTLAQLGYGYAYRILDARYFGVPQSRRRVYVVGYLGDWRCAAAVLFQPGTLQHEKKQRRARDALSLILRAQCGSPRSVRTVNRRIRPGVRERQHGAAP